VEPYYTSHTRRPTPPRHADPYYYTAEGAVHSLSISPGGSAEYLTEQGIDVGVPVSITILIDFDRPGEYTLNNGTVLPYTEGSFNFYAELINAPQIDAIDGGYYNGPLDRAELNYGWFTDYGDGTFGSSVYVGTGDVYYHFSNYTPWPTPITEWEAGANCDMEMHLRVFDSGGNAVGATVRFPSKGFSEIEPVPVPPAVILGSIGLAFSGWIGRRKKMF
jgi:hypothetical protein